jgi:LysR family transcriptional regulator, regulator for bpeEF and oprC
VKTLEVELGASLLERSSRMVALTPEGQLFFEQCRGAVASVQGAREILASARREPQGELVVTAPFVVGKLLLPALALLHSRFARLRFVVRFSDRLSRLAEESVDVAVRVGPMPPSSLITRLLRRTSLVTVASPAYLARRGTPPRPEALADHDTLGLAALDGKPRPWLFSGQPLPVPPTVLLDHGPSLVDAALAGLGVTQLFDFMADEHVRAGRLVLILEDQVSEGPDVHAVCAPGRRASANVRAAFHALADVFR